ncbi:MAG: hypothetical protein HZA34_02050 [Candidatus Pacebacteria bacterium]|nr:hypothetical protein [Candidatus Paceibacterota bacterium]
MKNKKIIFIVIGIIAVMGLIGAVIEKTSPSTTTSQSQATQQESIQNTPTPLEEVKDKVVALSHNELLKATKGNPNEVLSKKYEMTLYLEQAPTDTQAEFMSQPDDNSSDTILVTCNMKPNDLKRLDGASAQNRNYKPYNLNVTFTKYDSKVGQYYQAVCDIKL